MVSSAFLLALAGASALQLGNVGTSNSLLSTKSLGMDHQHALSYAGYAPTVKQFKKWKKKHNVKEDGQSQYETWLANLYRVVQHNREAVSGNHSFVVGMNQFAGMTAEEFAKVFLFESRSVPFGTPMSVSALNLGEKEELPNDWDWRTEGIVTPVKDQGHCGSCWAFATVASLEGLYNFEHKNGKMGGVDHRCNSTCINGGRCCAFSEQEMADCTRKGHFTCQTGGEMADAFWELAHNKKGILSIGKSYPYTSGHSRTLGSCHTGRVEVDTGIKGYAQVAEEDEQALKTAVFKRPGVASAVDASSWEFQLYLWGIFDASTCTKEVNHAITLVGYGEDYHGPAIGLGVKATGKHWLIKNSWGQNWGMNGYMMLARDAGNLCGIANEAMYPVSKRQEATGEKPVQGSKLSVGLHISE